jgi:hypothetical protein
VGEGGWEEGGVERNNKMAVRERRSGKGRERRPNLIIFKHEHLHTHKQVLSGSNIMPLKEIAESKAL